MKHKLIAVLILACLVVLFIIQNVAIVEVQFLFWSLQISKSLLMFLLFAVGIITGWIMNGYLKYRQRKSP